MNESTWGAARRWLLLLALLSGGSGRAEDAAPVRWPQFRGPTGQGITTTKGLPLHWGEQDNVAWKTPLPGEGHSSPVVWDSQIWVTNAASGGRSLGAICVDRDSGRILHEVSVFSPNNLQEIHADNSYASPTAAISAGRVYVHYGRYGTACIDTQTGEVLWRNTDQVIDHQGGPGSSPVLWGEHLILACDGADAQYVVALHTTTGDVAWRQVRSAPFRENPIYRRAFATPLLLEHDGQWQVICPGADQLQAYDPASGEELWSVRYVGFSNVPAPVADGDSVFLCTGFYSPELWSVRLGGVGNVTTSHLRWKAKGAVPEVPSPLVADERVYLVSNKGVATCYEADTGRRLWIKRLGGNYAASPLSDGSHIYFCREDGQTVVMVAGDTPEIVATNQLAGAIKASPAVAGRALIIRTDEALYRIEEAVPTGVDGDASGL